MQIKTFRARTVQEALSLVRENLGPDASILHTKEVSAGWMGWVGAKAIEVTASSTVPVASRFTKEESETLDRALPQNNPVAPKNNSVAPSPTKDRAPTERSAARRESIANESISSESPSISKSSLGSKPQADVQSQLQQLSSAVEMLMKQQPGNTSPVRKLPGALFEVFTELLDAEIDPVVARQLIEAAEQSCSEQQLADPWLIKGRISQWLQQQLKVANPLEIVAGQREIVALVGSTGVGKTTTLAKLAAGFHLQQGLSVGLITVDTFRMGAVDQLRGYAQIIDLPMEVVERPDQMPIALERLSDCQLILLDTTGRSPRDHEHLQYLSNLLSIARPTQVHLVVSATASPANLKATVEKFSIAKPTHMILTKLDEVGMLGGLLPFLQKGEFPLSYVTTGQNVPNDIQEANRRRLATMLLGQQSL